MAPYCKSTGSLIHRHHYKTPLIEYQDTEKVEWTTVTKFHKPLQFIYIQRNGDSLPSVLFQEVGTNSSFEMHLNDFEDLMNNNQIPIYPGKVWDCQWRVIKKYGKYWIRHIDP